MIVAVTAPSSTHRTALDRLIDGAGRACVAAGTRLAAVAHRRVEQRLAGSPARRAAAARRHAASERARDNTAQINPLGLR